MKEPNKYRAGLIEIKRRMKVIDQIGEGKLHVLYPATSVETAALQFRKVIELITFGSLIANKDIYSAVHEKFSKHWNAKLILQDLERIHPDFYPEPIHQIPTNRPDVQTEFVPRKDDYLTKDQLVSLYEECGGLLHAENPFGKQIDYDAFAAKTKNWRNRIVNLLNAHTIQLLGDENLYLFQMGTDGTPPTYTPFGKVDK